MIKQIYENYLIMVYNVLREYFCAWTIICKIWLEVAAGETKLSQIQIAVLQQKRQKTVYKKYTISVKKSYAKTIRMIHMTLNTY